MTWQTLSDPLFSGRLCLTLVHSIWQVALSDKQREWLESLRKKSAAPPEDPSKASERAIAGGLHWLARHQTPAGNWSLQHAKHCKGGSCGGPGTIQANAGATANDAPDRIADARVKPLPGQAASVPIQWGTRRINLKN